MTDIDREWDARIHGEDDLYRDASLAWGHDAQWTKAVEEFSELAAVCARDLNDQADAEDLLAEIVDARIMMEQITRHITDEALDEMAEEKLDELEERLHGEVTA
jgi:hypothetical protein